MKNLKRYYDFINEMLIDSINNVDQIKYFNDNKKKLEDLMVKSKDINDPAVKKNIDVLIKNNKFLLEWSNIVTWQLNVKKIEDRLNYSSKYISDKQDDIRNANQVQDTAERQSQIKDSNDEILQKNIEIQQLNKDLSKMKLDITKKITEFNNSLKDIVKK